MSIGVFFKNNKQCAIQESTQKMNYRNRLVRTSVYQTFRMFTYSVYQNYRVYI